MAARTRSRFDDLDAKPKSDAYTGILALSLIAMVTSCVILYLDYNQYGGSTAPTPNVPKVTAPSGINQGQPASGGGATPGILALIPSEPLLPVPLAAPEPIVPVSATETPLPCDPDEGPELPPPQ